MARVKEALAEIRGIEVRTSDADTLIAASGSAEVTVGFVDAPHVAVESDEIAAQFATSDKLREAVRGADARFELAWDLSQTGEAFNLLAWISERIEKLGCGPIFDPGSGTFV